MARSTFFWSAVKVRVRLSNARHAEARERVGRESSSLLGGWNRLCGKLLNWGIDHTPSTTTARKLPWKTQQSLWNCAELLSIICRVMQRQSYGGILNARTSLSLSHLHFQTAKIYFVSALSPGMLPYLVNAKEKPVLLSCFSDSIFSSSITKVKWPTTQRSVFSPNPNLLLFTVKDTMNQDVFQEPKVERHMHRRPTSCDSRRHGCTYVTSCSETKPTWIFLDLLLVILCLVFNQSSHDTV